MAGKKAKKKTSRRGPEKEEVCETFEIDKKGKKAFKTVCGSMEKYHASKNQIKTHNTILRNIFIVIGIIVLLIILGTLFLNSIRTFDYKGLHGKVVAEGDLIFYQMSFAYLLDGKVVPYHVYIRNDPEKLAKEIPFEGQIEFGPVFEDGMNRLVLNMSDSLNCEGHGIISTANMVNLAAIRTKVVKDDAASCDPEGRYMYANVRPGEKSEIIQTGPGCYELTVNDCEVLKVTERFMIEAYAQWVADGGL